MKVQPSANKSPSHGQTGRRDETKWKQMFVVDNGTLKREKY